jgi:hypothetical protein
VLGENPAVTLRIPVPVRRGQPQGQLPNVAGMLVGPLGLADLGAQRVRAGSHAIDTTFQPSAS